MGLNKFVRNKLTKDLIYFLLFDNIALV